MQFIYGLLCLTFEVCLPTLKNKNIMAQNRVKFIMEKPFLNKLFRHNA